MPGDLEVDIGVMKEQLRVHGEILNRIDQSINNNGGTGLSTRVSLLEQTERKREKHLLAIWSALVTMILKTIHDVLS